MDEEGEVGYHVAVCICVKIQVITVFEGKGLRVS